MSCRCWNDSAGHYNGLCPCSCHPRNVAPVKETLVVLDLGDSKPEIVLDVLRRAALYSLAEQIAEQAQPPKPAEPLELGAVVRATLPDGLLRLLVRVAVAGVHPWADAYGGTFSWAGITNPEVKHEGWSE